MKTTANNFKYIVDSYNNEIVYNPVHTIYISDKPITKLELDYILFLGANNHNVLRIKKKSAEYEKLIVASYEKFDVRILHKFLLIKKLKNKDIDRILTQFNIKNKWYQDMLLLRLRYSLEKSRCSEIRYNEIIDYIESMVF